MGISIEFNFGSAAWSHNSFNGLSNDKYLGSQKILFHFILPLVAYDSVHFFLSLTHTGKDLKNPY